MQTIDDRGAPRRCPGKLAIDRPRRLLIGTVESTFPQRARLRNTRGDVLPNDLPLSGSARAVTCKYCHELIIPWCNQSASVAHAACTTR
jgi:hypothetical protein